MRDPSLALPRCCRPVEKRGHCRPAGAGASGRAIPWDPLGSGNCSGAREMPPLITDSCSGEGKDLFCRAALGEASMNSLKLKEIRGRFLGLFKGKDTEMLARIGKTEICQAFSLPWLELQTCWLWLFMTFFWKTFWSSRWIFTASWTFRLITVSSPTVFHWILKLSIMHTNLGKKELLPRWFSMPKQFSL